LRRRDWPGGEARGFQAWHAPHGAPGPYGRSIVEPKWFEVHKEAGALAGQ